MLAIGLGDALTPQENARGPSDRWVPIPSYRVTATNTVLPIKLRCCRQLLLLFQSIIPPQGKLIQNINVISGHAS